MQHCDVEKVALSADNDKVCSVTCVNGAEAVDLFKCIPRKGSFMSVNESVEFVKRYIVRGAFLGHPECRLYFPNCRPRMLSENVVPDCRLCRPRMSSVVPECRPCRLRMSSNESVVAYDVFFSSYVKSHSSSRIHDVCCEIYECRLYFPHCRSRLSSQIVVPKTRSSGNLPEESSGNLLKTKASKGVGKNEELDEKLAEHRLHLARLMS